MEHACGGMRGAQGTSAPPPHTHTLFALKIKVLLQYFGEIEPFKKYLTHPERLELHDGGAYSVPPYGHTP